VKPTRDAFSLVELIAVLVIVSLVAASVSLRLSGPVRRAAMDDLAGRLAAFDRRARVSARRHDRDMQMAFDLSRGEVSWAAVGDAGGTSHTARGASPVAMPRGCRLAALVVAGGASAAGRKTTVGRAVVRVSRRGLSPTYAVCIETQRGERTWLLAAGLTGEVTRIDDDAQVREVFAALGGRADAR